jgi:hypothetical protein
MENEFVLEIIPQTQTQTPETETEFVIGSTETQPVNIFMF